MREPDHGELTRTATPSTPSPVLGPRALRRWLDEQIALEPLTALGPVHQSLRRLSDVDLPDRARFELLEEYAPALGAILSHAGRRRIGITLPVSPQGRALLGELGVLYGLLARNYMRMVQPGDNAPAPIKAPETAITTVAIERAMSNLIEVLATAYESYAPVPRGTWRDIHRLYSHARLLGLDGQRVPDPSNPVHPYTDIATVYRHALLLGLADPYQLPFRAVSRLRGRLPDWALLCKLGPARMPRRTRCRFIVDLDEDGPGRPVLGRETGLDAARFLLLDTWKLTASLHRSLEALKATLWDSGRSPGVRDLELIDLLRVLIVRWGMHPIRARSRAAHVHNYEVVAGLRAVANFVAKADRTHGMAEAVELHSRSDKAAAPQVHPVLSRDWRSIDVSATGWRLGITGSSDVEVRVGELVALRSDPSTPWSVGAVRWGRGRDGGTFEIGIQRLGDSPTAVTLRSVSVGADNRADRSTEAQRPALYLAPAVDGATGLLITEPGGYRPGASFHVHTDTMGHLLEARELVYATRSFECFSFQLAYGKP